MNTLERGVAAIACLVLAWAPHGGSAAATGEPPPGHCRDDCFTDAAGGQGGIDVYKSGRSEHVPGRGDANYGPAPGKVTWLEVEEDMAPTCFGNERGYANALCAAAVNTCPDGLVRFWVWHRVLEYTRVNGQTTSTVKTPWYQEDGTFCLGADDPGVPKIARIIDRIRTDFTHLPLLPSQIRSDPGPTTVVNIKTAFSAGTTEPQTFAPVLLGSAVHVTAKPVEWRWTWGDGTTSVTTTPGVPQQPVVTHAYTRVADAGVSVVVKFAGTFSIGSDPTQYAIATPAFSPPSPISIVKIREARSQLVSH